MDTDVDPDFAVGQVVVVVAVFLGVGAGRGLEFRLRFRIIAKRLAPGFLAARVALRHLEREFIDAGERGFRVRIEGVTDFRNGTRASA
jgi:hypothetical protein